MIYKYPDYEENPFGFLEGVTNETLDNYYFSESVVERFKVVDNNVLDGVKENMYAVSSRGRVYNIRTGKELSQITDKHYYKYIGIQKSDNSRVVPSVHRLVAKAFIDKTEEDISMERDTVNHKDLCPANNDKRNLEWTTNEENIIHAIKNNARGINKVIQPKHNHWSDGSVTKGENNGMNRISDEQIHTLCKSLESGNSRKQACIDAALKADQNDLFVVSHILQGQRRQDISSQYNLPEVNHIRNYTEEQVNTICRLLENNISITDIANEIKKDDNYHTNNSIRTVIRRIKNKSIYLDISKNYNF